MFAISSVLLVMTPRIHACSHLDRKMHTKLILGLYIVKAGSLFKYIDQFTYFCHSQMAILICVQIIMTTWVV